MTADAVVDLGEIRIQPFDPDNHDRTAFSSGVTRIDNFLKRTAKKHQSGDFTKVWVASGSDPKRVLGFYAVNAHELDAGDLPDALSKHAPRHGRVPAAYLSMIGVDLTYQGAGLGRVLLTDALKKALTAADQIGIKAIVLDVIPDGGAAALRRRQDFYGRMGFIALPDQPTRMFMPIEVVRRALA